MLHYQEGEVEPSQPRLVQFQGHHANQAYYKSGIMPTEYGENPILPGYFILFSLLILSPPGRAAFDIQ